jgi:hypothetical protein
MSFIIVRTISRIFWNYAISCFKKTVKGMFLFASILDGVLNFAMQAAVSIGSKLAGKLGEKSFSILNLTSSSRERPPAPPDSFG